MFLFLVLSGDCRLGSGRSSSHTARQVRADNRDSDDATLYERDRSEGGQGDECGMQSRVFHLFPQKVNFSVCKFGEDSRIITLPRCSENGR
jgi:hypothetical protein